MKTAASNILNGQSGGLILKTISLLCCIIIQKRRLLKKVKIKRRVFSKGLVTFFSGEDFKELRDYIPGEDIRNIHWLSSARHQKLLSVEREPLKNQKISLVVLLDKNMRYLDKFEILKEAVEILVFSALFYKQKIHVYVVAESVKIFVPRKVGDEKKILNYLDSLKLANSEPKKFYLKEKNTLAVYLGDFFYKIKLNRKNKNYLLFIRKKIEERPKKLLFNTLKSVDSKEKTFLDFDNLKHYLSLLKKNDDFYKREKVRKIYFKNEVLSVLKDALE